MMLVDTHSHVNFSAYKSDADEVIRRSLGQNTAMINVGSQYSTSKKAVEISQKHKNGVYAAVGLHPIHAKDGFDYEKYKQLARSFGVVAVGETGLDYKKEYLSFKEKQKEVFLKQISLAQELSLPIVFHCRMAHDDLIEILSNHSLRGVVHCFTGKWKQAEKYLEMGLFLGFNGIIFKLNLDDIIKKTPLDRILIETDCPYLTPLPKQGRNEPVYVKYVAERISKIRDIDLEKTFQATTENARALFGI